MHEPQSWPPPRVPDREVAAASTASFDREDDREFPVTTWPPTGDREDGGPRVRVVKPGGQGNLAVPGEDGEWTDEPQLPAFMSALAEWRFLRDSTTSAQAIEYALAGAYSMKDGWWRNAHIVYAYVIGMAVILLCDAVKFSFGLRLSRALVAIPTTVALGWALNHVPIIEWLIPDGWDVTTWGQPDPTVVVEVPVESPIGQG